MKITASAISLNVDDPAGSAEFAKRHFGFEEEMSADGFVSLTHPSAGFNLVFLAVGLETFKPPALAGHRADGVLVVFVVDDVDAEYARLVGDGVEITTPIETEEWGERFFQVTDPNGVVFQLVTWTSSLRRSPAELVDPA
jgi:predicted enzyme related to lactoylglutathione lyase